MVWVRPQTPGCHLFAPYLLHLPLSTTGLGYVVDTLDAFRFAEFVP